MPNEEPLTPADRELEAALQGLAPAAPGIDRDRLMFVAGQASARRRQRVWQGATATLAAAFAILLAVRPASRPTDRFVRVGDRSPSANGTAATPTAVAPSSQDVDERPAPYVRPRDDMFVFASGAFPVRADRAAMATEPLPTLERLSDTATQRSRMSSFFGLEKLIDSGDRL